MSTPQARMLLLDLSEFATHERFVYSHVWRATVRPNEARDIRQMRLTGDGPTIAQDAA